MAFSRGVVNGHIHGCFRAEDYIQPHTTWERGARWSAFRLVHRGSVGWVLQAVQIRSARGRQASHAVPMQPATPSAGRSTPARDAHA